MTDARRARTCQRQDCVHVPADAGEDQHGQDGRLAGRELEEGGRQLPDRGGRVQETGLKGAADRHPSVGGDEDGRRTEGVSAAPWPLRGSPGSLLPMACLYRGLASPLGTPYAVPASFAPTPFPPRLMGGPTHLCRTCSGGSSSTKPQAKRTRPSVSECRAPPILSPEPGPSPPTKVSKMLSSTAVACSSSPRLRITVNTYGTRHIPTAKGLLSFPDGSSRPSRPLNERSHAAMQ